MQFLRKSSVLSLLVATLLMGAVSGRDLMHFTVAHEVEHHYAPGSRECCKPDHRQPHMHEQNFCFLCHVEVSVTMHEEHVVLTPCTISFTLSPAPVSSGVFHPGFQGYADLRGPPTA